MRKIIAAIAIGIGLAEFTVALPFIVWIAA